MECPTCGKMLNTERGMRQHHTKVHDEPLPNRECVDCGCEFYDPKAQRTYCDDCYSEDGVNNGNWKEATETATCAVCGDEFEYYPSDKDGVYCQECVAGANGLLPENPSEPLERVTVECGGCGCELRVRPTRVERNERGVFCDFDCYGEWLSENVTGEAHHQWEGGKAKYGGRWWTVRRAALARDDNRCQQCGKTAQELGKRPDVHHLTPVREFEDPQRAHTLDNVITLCRSCHRHVEERNISAPSPSPER